MGFRWCLHKGCETRQNKNDGRNCQVSVNFNPVLFGRKLISKQNHITTRLYIIYCRQSHILIYLMYNKYNTMYIMIHYCFHTSFSPKNPTLLIFQN